MRPLRWGWILVLLLSCERFYFKPPPSETYPFLPDNLSGKVLVSAQLKGEDSGIYVVGTASGEVETVVDLPASDEVFPSANGNAVVFSSDVNGDFGIFLYDGDTSLVYDPPSDQLWPSLSPSGDYVAFVTFEGDSGGNLGVYDRRGRYVQVWYDTLPLPWLTFVNDSLILAVRGGSLQVFSLASLMWESLIDVGDVLYPKVSPSGNKLALVEVGDSFRVVITSYPDGGNRRVLRSFSDSVRGLAWSPDGDYVALGYGDRVYVLDTTGSLYLLRDSLRGVYVGDWVR